MANKFAVDTNVLIYLHDNSNKNKREIAIDILANKPSIASQVVSEYLNVARRILSLSKDELLEQTAKLFSECVIIPVSPGTLNYASKLIKQYKFQLFDAIIIAAAIEAQCDMLYSEDMHHKLLVDNKLTIINPFI